MQTATFNTKRQELRPGLAFIALFTALIFIACNKTETINPQVPSPVDTAAYLQLSVSGVQPSGKTLYGLLSIDSKSGQPVLTNKKVTLTNQQGQYRTDKIKIDKGEYQLSKFIVVNTADTAEYATPKMGSQKASGFAKPLSQPIAIISKGITVADIQTIPVAATELPDAFGYTADDFGYHNLISLRVTLKINVGEVGYDSLPGKLNIDAATDFGGHWTRELDLQKGVTTVLVPEHYASYHFTVAKWNVIANKTINRAALQQNMTVALEASRLPKRLVEEKTFIENAAATVPDSRTQFFYNGANKLGEIRNYQKSLQQPDLVLTNIYKFQYVNNRLDTIKRFSPGDVSTGYTAFFYENGRISNISNQSYDQHTGVAFDYVSAGGNDVVEADYLFHNGNTMFYRFFPRNGNRILDQALSSTGGSESGVYEYDDYINPKHQLGWEDIFFSNYSKNNKVKEQKNYGGSFPSVVPYKFEYIYDSDGYPAEVYVSYKGFTSQQHQFRIKTIYMYQ